jgi:hypothetical protein
MRPILIHHPLKRIQFSYHSEAGLNHFESAFIDRYKLLHDELAGIKNQILELKPGIDIVVAEFNTVRVAFETLHQKIGFAEHMFGLCELTETTTECSLKPGEITHVLNEFQQIRQQYWSIMVPMHNLFNSVCERFSAFDEAVEKFEKEFAEPMFHNYSIMEIDSRSFRKDMNEFRIEWMAIASLQDHCVDEYSEWAKQQLALVKDSDELYGRIKRLFRHMYHL